MLTNAHSAGIPVPVFKQLTCLEDLTDVKECIDSKDAPFKIHKDSVHREFDQNAFACHLSLSKKL